MALNKYDLDLSNEVININVGEGLQKYQRSKLKIEKNLPVQLGTGLLGSILAELAIFLSTSNFDIFQPLLISTYKQA